jgi:hypothetical protein
VKEDLSGDFPDYLLVIHDKNFTLPRSCRQVLMFLLVRLLFRCWKEEGHGGMNLMSAIINSCDVYFYGIGEMMDVDVLAASATAYGLDRKTGVDLPIEVAGNVPTRRYYDKRFGKRGWTQGLMINNAIGQGEYLATVLQVARIAAAVANGGWLVHPRFVDHADGEAQVERPRERARAEGSTSRSAGAMSPVNRWNRPLTELVAEGGGEDGDGAESARETIRGTWRTRHGRPRDRARHPRRTRARGRRLGAGPRLSRRVLSPGGGRARCHKPRRRPRRSWSAGPAAGAGRTNP